MNNFINTKQYKQFSEFCKACHRDKYIGLCYGLAGVGKTESARHYSNWYQVIKSNKQSVPFSPLPIPTFSMKRLNSILYTPNILENPKQMIFDIKKMQKKFSWLKEKYIYGEEIPMCAREENRNFAELVIIDESERLKPQSFELIREVYDQGETNFIFIGMPGIEKTLERFPQLYSRVGFVHQFKNLGKVEVEFIINKNFSKLGIEIDENNFSDQEAISAVIRMTNGNFRLINRLLKQSIRIMKVNHMTILTKEIIEAARSCLLIGEK
jgi:DNA transposition AAA+ family ATPase